MNAKAIVPTINIPELQPGDRLTRAEFERRYQAMPECKKAELIEGIVYLSSPVHYDGHATPHLCVCTWLGVYWSATPGVSAGDNGSNRLDLKNMPQPDCMMLILPECGGQVHRSKDDYIVGPPEFVAEVSGSTLATDRGPKLRTFRRHGVKEYLIWRVRDRKLEWNILVDGEYQLLNADADGVFRSEVFPGLWLDSEALLGGNLAKVLATLQQGISSSKHRKFVKELARRRKS